MTFSKFLFLYRTNFVKYFLVNDCVSDNACNKNIPLQYNLPYKYIYFIRGRFLPDKGNKQQLISINTIRVLFYFGCWLPLITFSQARRYKYLPTGQNKFIDLFCNGIVGSSMKVYCTSQLFINLQKFISIILHSMYFCC